MTIQSPFKLTTANLTIKLQDSDGNLNKFKGITDITFKFDPKATILNSATHERVGVYWGPPEVSIDLSCYAAEDKDKTILWAIHKAAMTREFTQMSLEVTGENTDLVLSRIEITKGVVTAITPMKIATDGVQTMDFTITAMDWLITDASKQSFVGSTAPDADGPSPIS